MQLGGCADFLRTFIWSSVSGLTRFCNGSHKRTASNFVQNFGKSVPDVLAMFRQVFGEESMRRIQKVQTHRDQKSGTDEEQSQKQAHHFLSHQENCSQRILLGRPHSLRESIRRLHPELWRQKNWLLHHDNTPSHTSLFNQGIFLSKTT
jgi:hypothetical protein